MEKSELILRFRGKSGDSVDQVFADLEKAAQPTIGDLLFAGQRQRSRILMRTSRGIDADGGTFAPYSLKGPVYYYPGKTATGRRKSVKRIADKLGITGNRKVINVKGATTQYVQKTTLGLKFSSYAALKAAFGRLNVDLRGIVAPHMLQALIVRVMEFTLGDNAKAYQPLPNVATEPADQINIGIYGAEAIRANKHQKGLGNMPRRKFIGANGEDQKLMIQDILSRMLIRARTVTGAVSKLG